MKDIENSNTKENAAEIVNRKKIGIFGGTFDPWTVGHAAVLTKAFQQKLVDKIFIVPTTVNYYRPDKRYLFSFDEKLLIIRDFLVGFKYDAEIDTVEKDKNGDWRTIDLVQYFKERFPNDELYLIIGEDSFKEFKTWTRYEDILKYAKLIVANRKDHVVKTQALTNEGQLPAIPLDMGNAFEDCSATKVRNRLIEELMDMYLSDRDWYNDIG